MPYYTDGPIGPNPDQVSLEDFRASGLLSIKTAMSDAWESNPSSLAVDYFRLRKANDGQRLDRASAEGAIKQAGVKLEVPESGYTAEALDMLISRKQDETRRADIMARAPTGIVPTSTRFAAQLLAGVVDPLNVAAAFIPVVGEARYASMLARAGESVVSRAGARFAAGAAEGAVGVALMEPFAYGAHQQLQDDYHAVDSLMNIAFGAALGGTLHAGAGAIGDLMRGGAHPALRFRDMSVEDVQGVLNFEKERTTLLPADQARAIESFTPEMRRAIGEPEPAAGGAAAPAQDPTGPRSWLLRQEPSPMAAAAVHDRLSPEIKATAMRSAVTDMLQGRMPDVDRIVGLDPAAAPRRTVLEVSAEAKPGPGGIAEPVSGHIATSRGAQLAVEREFSGKYVARDAEGGVVATLQYTDRPQGGFRVTGVEVIPARRREGIANALYDFIETAVVRQPLAEAGAQSEAGAAFRAARREAAGRATGSLDAARATAERQARPESVAIADFFAARQAEQRLAEAPAKSEPLAAAEADMATAGERLESVRKNLEQAGHAPEKLQQALDEMKPFDDAVNDAKSLGDAARAAAICGVRS